MDKQNTTKPHVNIGSIGHIDQEKSTLTEAISNYLAKKGQKDFDDYTNIDIPNKFHNIELEQSCRQSSESIMIKTKKFDYPYKKRKKQK